MTTMRLLYPGLSKFGTAFRIRARLEAVDLSRRGFLGAAGSFWIAGQDAAPAKAKLRIACIGVGGRGAAAVQVARGEELVALCDVDSRRLDVAGVTAPAAKKYADYRELLDRERGLDAVIVSTPDHHHALASLLAIRRGLHVYCEKPLARSVDEVRRLREYAARAGRVVTQEGTQGHASNARRTVVEMLRAGVIGAVTEVHAWSNRPIWPAGLERPAAAVAPPPALSWDLWLGPAPERPYHPAYLPFKWRGWWDFANGALGDMGSHLLDAAFWALDLGTPEDVEAEGEPRHAESTPRWMTARWSFPARGEAPPLVLRWYDGMKLPAPELLQGVPAPGNGTLFVGKAGSLLLMDEQGTRWKLLPEAKFAGYLPPAPTLPRVPAQNNFAEWVAACKGEGKALCGFAAAAPLAEAVLLATAAFRAGRKLLPREDVVPFLRPPRRPGWELPPRPTIRKYK